MEINFGLDERFYFHLWDTTAKWLNMHSTMSACIFYHRTVESMMSIKVWGELFVDCVNLNLLFIINDCEMRISEQVGTCTIAYWNSVNYGKSLTKRGWGRWHVCIWHFHYNIPSWRYTILCTWRLVSFFYAASFYKWHFYKIATILLLVYTTIDVIIRTTDFYYCLLHDSNCHFLILFR